MAQASAVLDVAFARPLLGDPEIDEVVATLHSGWLSTGPRVREFERRFATYTGAAHAIAVNSCTAGLHLSLLAAGIGVGDEVITTPLTFCATLNAIVHVGATPVLVDIDSPTMNLDPAAVAAACTPSTRAVLPVHFAGRPVDSSIASIARDRDLWLIEDAAHCVEGISAGRKVGTIADLTCFSFYATKNLTTGEGGMVTTDSEQLADWIRVAALHGMTRDAWARYAGPVSQTYQVVMAGFKYNMMDLQAAIGLHQLAELDARLARRATLWRRYEAGLEDLPVGLPGRTPAGDLHARHLFTIQVDPQTAGCSRDELRQRLGDHGIATSIHFPALHLQPYYAQRFGYSRGMFPCAERVADQTLSLPFSASLSDDEVDRVVDVLHELLPVR